MPPRNNALTILFTLYMNISIKKTQNNHHASYQKKGKLVVLVSLHLGDLGYAYFYYQELKNPEKNPCFQLHMY